jgi:transposase
MARKTAYQYHSDEFKLTAARLSELDDVLIKDVAESLDIHPFMLSLWKKDVGDGKLVTKEKLPKIDIESAA